MIVDTHVHLFAEASDARFPIHANAPYAAAVPALPRQVLSFMDQAGIAGAVLVHPETYQDDHRWLLHTLAIDPKRFRGVCHLFPDRAETPEKIAELARFPGMAGMRLHAYCPERLPSFEPKSLTRFWTLARDNGLFLQLHLEPRYAPVFTPLLQRFPEVVVLIDHCGRPFQGTLEEFQEIRGWARFPQVHMKLSLLPFRNQYPHRDIGPVVQDLATQFGIKRILYGGGYPCASPQEWTAHVERFLDLLGRLGPEEKSLILGDNAARILKWDLTG